MTFAELTWCCVTLTSTQRTTQLLISQRPSCSSVKVKLTKSWRWLPSFIILSTMRSSRHAAAAAVYCKPSDEYFLKSLAALLKTTKISIDIANLSLRALSSDSIFLRAAMNLHGSYCNLIYRPNYDNVYGNYGAENAAILVLEWQSLLK